MVGTQAVGIQGNLEEEVLLDSTGDEVGGHCSPPVGEEAGCTHKEQEHHTLGMGLGEGHHCSMAAVVGAGHHCSMAAVVGVGHHCVGVVAEVGEGWLLVAVGVDCLTVPWEVVLLVACWAVHL